jgi:hypothetical protein
MFPTYEQVVSHIDADIQAIVAARKQSQALFRRWQTAAILAAVLAILSLAITSVIESLQSFTMMTLVITGAIAAILIIATIIIGFTQHAKLTKHFKENIVAKIAQTMVSQCQLPNQSDEHHFHCSYEPSNHISPSMVDHSKLFPYHIDKYRGADLFTGQIGLTAFEFSELHLIQVQTSVDSKGRTTRRDVTMFKGILYVVDFNKKFNGITTLHAETMVSNSFIGKWLQPLRRMSRGSYEGQKKLSIDVENEDFNRAFDITTTDEIEARYILSSSMIERILEFRKRHPQKTEISFVDSLMCISLQDSKNYFEIKLFAKNIDKELRLIYEDFRFFFGMVEVFDLNTRIWSKE